jgi:GNAT superfamily N-acetyltransferase
MPPVRFEEYRADLAPSAIALWNRALGEDFPMTARLWRQRVDRDRHARPGDGLVAFATDGAPAGLVVVRRFRGDGSEADMEADADLGWIVALAVAPEWQGRGLGSELLRRAEARLREDGARRSRVSRYPLCFLPGPPLRHDRAIEFWRRHGYTPRGLVHDVRRSLADWAPPPPPPAVADGAFAIGPGRRGEEPALLSYLRERFPGGWRYAVEEALARGAPIDDVLVLRDRGGRIRGFLASWHFESPVLGSSVYWHPAMGDRFGGMGPLGIDDDVRGGGLGLALVRAGATALRERGVEACVIDWTTLLELYGRAGFQAFRSYWTCDEKSLAP